MLDCKVELKLSREFGIGARCQFRRACGVRVNRFKTGLSEFVQLLTVQVLELEPSEERNEAVFERRVVHVVTEKIRTTYFLGFVLAEPRDDKAGLAIARAPTHL